MYSFRKNWELDLTLWHIYCSLLQPVVVYNFSEIRSTFPVLFWDFIADSWWLCGMVSIFLIRKAKFDWFLHETGLLDWLFFLQYLLQSFWCWKNSAKITNFSFLNLFLHFLHRVVVKHFRIFVTVMWCKFCCLLKFSAWGTYKIILLILSCGILLAWFSMLEINSI